jgi:hypothetical protein
LGIVRSTLNFYRHPMTKSGKQTGGESAFKALIKTVVARNAQPARRPPTRKSK